VNAKARAAVSREPSELTWPVEPHPKVSIIIPNHNYAQYVREAVVSALGQTYRSFEILVIDDGSTDDSLEVLSAFASDHPRVRVYSQENRGLAATRNIAIGLARGEYILPLDADDLIHPEFLAHTVPVLEANQTVGFVYTQMVWFGDVEQLRSHWEYDFELLKRGNFVNVSSLFRKQAWSDVGGYDEVMQGYEDWDFWIGLAEQGWIGQLVREPLFFYRRHGRSMIDGCDENREQLMEQIKRNHPKAFSPGFDPRRVG
jgi:glycosyltransferase involved in cell wall biosynthesis